MNREKVRWRHLGGASVLLMVCVAISIASKGCAAGALRSWGTDEVVLAGAGNAEKGGHRNFSLLLDVKNVAGLADGKYEIRQPTSWETAPRRRGPDGIDEVATPLPLTLEAATNDGVWGWWQMKVVAVSPARVRDPVSSFFTTIVSDGSVPGEFRRLGVSIVRDGSRDYRLTLLGEDPRSDRWLRIGILPVGRGTQSSVRPAFKFVLLPLAFAVDVGLVPLAFSVLALAVFLVVRRSVPMTLTVMGLLLIAGYPLVLISEAREQNDIKRALRPFVFAPVDDLRMANGRELELTIPGDSQWQRIVRRMGKPSVLVVPADVERRQTYAAADMGLVIRVTRNGSVVNTTATSDAPYAYSTETSNNGFKFAADTGDRLVIGARATASHIPPNATLIVAPNWGNLNTWDWVDGAAMAYGFLELVSALVAVIGLALLASGAVIHLRKRAHRST